ncbi:hypothetical protein ACFCV8_28780 [Streptomyces sp. NPDC056347]|uniref:hypothetical protein n=1 Tax=Streptomyces sp. NPDC056347 TaxID=3345790 RepID=UPI0035D6D043
MKLSMGSVSRTVLRGVVTAGAAGALALAVSVVTAGTAAATPPGLSCDTGKHAVDDYTGYALCSNDGGATQTFWVHLVCGWAPDVDGEHITLAPGQSGQSTAHCADIGTGIGEISVQP